MDEERKEFGQQEKEIGLWGRHFFQEPLRPEGTEWPDGAKGAEGAEGTDLGVGGVDDDVNGDIGLPPHGRLVATSSDPARHPPHFAITHNLATQTNTHNLTTLSESKGVNANKASLVLEVEA